MAMLDHKEPHVNTSLHSLKNHSCQRRGLVIKEHRKVPLFLSPVHLLWCSFPEEHLINTGKDLWEILRTVEW